jgi:hypothetical protein
MLNLSDDARKKLTGRDIICVSSIAYGTMYTTDDDHTGRNMNSIFKPPFSDPCESLDAPVDLPKGRRRQVALR